MNERPTEAEHMAACRYVKRDPNALMLSRDDLDWVLQIVANVLAAERIKAS